MFLNENDWSNSMVDIPHLISGSGKLSTLRSLGHSIVENDDLYRQLLVYIHVTLGGFCSSGTALDEPRMAAWQDEIEHVKARVGFCENMLGSEERFKALEKRVEKLQELADHGGDALPEHSPKRQKVKDTQD